MGGTVDRLGLALLDGALAASALVGLIALAMIACGQPARRTLLARGAIWGALLVLPLANLAHVPRIRLALPLLDLINPYRPGVQTLFRSTRPILRPFVVLSVSGTAMGLGWLFLGGWGCLRLAAGTVEPSPETLAIYEDLPFHGPAPRPRLRVAARIGRPVLLGPIRPTILLPTDFDQPGSETPLRLGLIHELAHAERLDPFFTLCGSLAQAVWFFVPPLWWVRHQMRLDQEFLADRVASSRYGPSLSYASSLIQVAAEPRLDGTAEIASGRGPTSPASALFQRVLMLVKCPYPVEPRPPRWWAAIVIPLIACATVAASGLTLRSRPDPDPPPPSCHDGHGRIHYQRLAPEIDPSANGPARPFDLLDTLPPHFELEADLWADPSDLVRISIAGKKLGPMPLRAGEAPPVEGYHHLRMIRDDRGISAWINARPIPPHPFDTPPPASLAVEPAPGRSIRFRDLRITW